MCFVVVRLPIQSSLHSVSHEAAAKPPLEKEQPMKTIHCWNDLSAYGIELLTGEACGLSYRLLCDVTAAGKKLIEKAGHCPVGPSGELESEQ